MDQGDAEDEDEGIERWEKRRAKSGEEPERPALRLLRGSQIEVESRSFLPETGGG